MDPETLVRVSLAAHNSSLLELESQRLDHEKQINILKQTNNDLLQSLEKTKNETKALIEETNNAISVSENASTKNEANDDFTIFGFKEQVCLTINKIHNLVLGKKQKEGVENDQEMYLNEIGETLLQKLAVMNSKSKQKDSPKKVDHNLTVGEEDSDDDEEEEIENCIKPQISCQTKTRFGQTEIRVKSARQQRKDENMDDDDDHDDVERNNQQRERIKLKNRLASPKSSKVEEEHEKSYILVEKRENTKHLDRTLLKNKITRTKVKKPEWNPSTVVATKSPVVSPVSPASPLAVFDKKSQEPENIEERKEVNEIPPWMRGSNSRPISTAKSSSRQSDYDDDISRRPPSSGSEREREESSFAKFVDLQIKAEEKASINKNDDDDWYKEMREMTNVMSPEVSDEDYSSDAFQSGGADSESESEDGGNAISSLVMKERRTLMTQETTCTKIPSPEKLEETNQQITEEENDLSFNVQRDMNVDDATKVTSVFVKPPTRKRKKKYY
jgi:hypothetical protein